MISAQKSILFCVTQVEQGKGGIARLNRAYLSGFQSIETQQKHRLQITILSLATLSAESQHWLQTKEIRGTSANGSSLRFVLQLLRVLLTESFQLVIYDHIGLAQTGIFVRGLFKTPYAVLCHGIEFSYSMPLLKQIAFRLASLRVANSKFTKSNLEVLFPKLKVSICYPGLAIESSTVLKKKSFHFLNALNNKAKVEKDFILIVGRLNSAERYKGHRELISALNSIKTTFPNIQLLIVGEGDDLKSLQKFAVDRSVGEHVLFIGKAHSDLLHRLYMECVFFAMPSRGEGFGLVYLEAMAMGKAVLASNADAGREIVQHYKTGVICSPDENSIARSITFLLSSARRRKQFGNCGQKRYQEIFSQEAFNERVCHTFEPVLGPMQISSLLARKKRRKQTA